MRLILFLLLALPLGAQDLAVPCEASKETLALLEAIPPLRDIGIPYEQRIGRLRALAAQNPENFFIQRAYQDSFRQLSFLPDEFDRALAMYRQRGNDPLSQYHAARLLMYVDSQRSRATFDQLLNAHPRFVWPHLEFVEWAAMPGLQRVDDPSPHLKAFRAACPEAAPMAARPIPVENSQAMRKTLERRNTPLDLSLWPQLWTAEEKAGIAGDVLQQRVRADLKRIQAWPFRPDPALSLVYREASRILKDQALMEELKVKVASEAPDSQLASGFAESRWYEENPRPQNISGAEGQIASREYRQKESAARQEWLRQAVNVPSSVMGLFRDLQQRAHEGEAGLGSPADLAVVDRFLDLKRESPDAIMQVPPMEIGLARIYVKGKVRLESVPKLLDQGLQNVERQQKYRVSAQLFPEETRSRMNDWQGLTWLQAEQIRAEYLLATDRPADARVLVEQAIQKLDTKRPVSPQEQGRWRYDRTEWLRRLADVDAREGRVEDALRHYQESLSTVKKEFLTMPGVQQRLAPIREYYLAHGGTEAKWPDWASEKFDLDGAVAARPALSFIRPLAQFIAKDLAGQTWQLSELNGKATFVNFWATWCGPCRYEHPDIQKLYDRIKDRKDIRVLTISVDDSPSAVTDYLKEKGYTFPVVHSPELAEKLFPYVGLPTNFLVDTNGVRTSMYGFASVDRVLEDLQKASAR